MAGPCIIIDADDRRRSDLVRLTQRSGLKGIVEASSVAEAEERSTRVWPLRLAVVAVDAPAEPPLALLSRLRVQLPDCLLIAVDVCDSADSAMRAFAAGAHDVLRLPFRPAEYEVRLSRGLVRTQLYGDVIAESLVARLDLTDVQKRILRMLATRQGDIVTRNELSQRLFGTNWSYGDRRFDVHMTQIRRKLREATDDIYTVQTVRSRGYCFDLTSRADDSREDPSEAAADSSAALQSPNDA